MDAVLHARHWELDPAGWLLLSLLLQEARIRESSKGALPAS